MNKACCLCLKNLQDDKFVCFDQKCHLNEVCCRDCMINHHRNCNPALEFSESSNSLIKHFPNANFKLLDHLVKKVKCNTMDLGYYTMTLSKLIQYASLPGNSNEQFIGNNLRLIRDYSIITSTNNNMGIRSVNIMPVRQARGDNIMNTVKEKCDRIVDISKETVELVNSKPFRILKEASDSNWLFDQRVAFKRDNQKYRFSLVRLHNSSRKGYKLITNSGKYLLLNRELSDLEAYTLKILSCSQPVEGLVLKLSLVDEVYLNDLLNGKEFGTGWFSTVYLKQSIQVEDINLENQQVVAEDLWTFRIGLNQELFIEYTENTLSFGTEERFLRDTPVPTTDCKYHLVIEQVSDSVDFSIEKKKHLYETVLPDDHPFRFVDQDQDQDSESSGNSKKTQNKNLKGDVPPGTKNDNLNSNLSNTNEQDDDGEMIN